jgi:hypothetical protein
LTAFQVSSIWPTQSKFDFAIVSSFILAMLFTAPDQEQFYLVHERLHSWRWALQHHSLSNQELVVDALARIASFYNGDAESLLNMVRSHKHHRPA